MKELARAETPNPEGVGGKANKTVTSVTRTQQSPYAQTLEYNGISRQTAGKYQAMADRAVRLNVTSKNTPMAVRAMCAGAMVGKHGTNRFVESADALSTLASRWSVSEGTIKRAARILREGSDVLCAERITLTAAVR